MGFRIATNIQSLAAQRNLSTVKGKQEKSLERLSSGSRITRAGDDAASLAISEKLKSEIRGSKQAERNAGDGISLVQTAEGGLNEVSSILIRLRELSIQAASDTIGQNERKIANLEFQQLVKEVDRIANSTRFNDRQLLSGQGEVVDIQVGIKNNPSFDRLTYNSSDSNATSGTLGIGGLNVAEKSNAQNNLEVLDKALSKVNGSRAKLGALQNRLVSTINNLTIQHENLSAANSRIRDVDVATETAELTKANILTSSGTSVLAQANVSGQAALKLLN